MYTNLMSSSFRFLAVTLTIGLGSPAWSQEPTTGDLAALRYYYEQGNEDSVRAETRRLMLQFPQWSPPEDIGEIFTASGAENLDSIYRLIEQGDYAAARALISETSAALPDWTPPTELTDLLRLSEAQSEFDAASQSNDPARVIAIVRGVPGLLSCERVNNAWLLAEAHLGGGNTSAALGIYRGVLQTCSAPETLIATLEKTAVVAPTDVLAQFSDIAQAQAPDAVSEIRAVEDRLRAGRQEPPRWQNRERVIALDPEGPVVSVLPTTETANAGTPAVRPTARPSAQASTAATSSSATTAPRSVSGGILAIQAAAQQGAWAQCLALSAGSTRVDVVMQRGWCAYNADRPMEALAAFQVAAGRGTSAAMRLDATYGALLSMLRLSMTDQAAQVAASASLTRTQRLEVEGQILDQRGIRAYEAGEYRRAIAYFAAHEDLMGVTRRDLALLRGYALLNLGDRAGAGDVFRSLDRELSTADTRGALRALN